MLHLVEQLTFSLPQLLGAQRNGGLTSAGNLSSAAYRQGYSHDPVLGQALLDVVIRIRHVPCRA